MADSAIQSLSTNPIFKRILNILPVCLNVLFVVLIAYYLSLLIWKFIPVPEGRPVPNQTALSNNQPIAQKIFYGSQIASLNVFGKSEEKKAPETKDIKKTRLNLKLIGVLAHNPEEEALAIVSSGRGMEKVYGIGEKLPGNAELKEVHADHIIIEYQGRLEKLELPEGEGVSLASSRPSSPRTTNTARSPSAISPQRAVEIRNDLLANPSKVLNMVTLGQERRGGRLLGYRVNPKGDPSLFYELGLQDGDVITAVNGIPVSDQRSLGGLRDAERYDVTVLRGGVETALSLSFR